MMLSLTCINSKCHWLCSILQGKHLQDKCDAILSKLQCNSESKHGFTSCKSVEPTVTIAPIPLHSKKRDHKSLSSRLSMYSMDIKESKGNQKKRSDLRRKSIRNLPKVLHYFIYTIWNIL